MIAMGRNEGRNLRFLLKKKMFGENSVRRRKVLMKERHLYESKLSLINYFLKAENLIQKFYIKKSIEHKILHAFLCDHSSQVDKL